MIPSKHGEFVVEQYGQIVVIRAFGRWNIEQMTHFNEFMIGDFMLPVIKEPWVSITDIREWDLTSPEAFEVIEGMQQWGWVNNLQRQVILSSSVVKESIYAVKGGMINETKTLYTDDESFAWVWLDEHGFEKTALTRKETNA